LEYRGYDSAGVAFEPLQGDNSGRIEVVKTLGGVAALQQRLDTLVDTEATTAIGHNRWATHGVPSEVNAHPHTNSDNTIAVVHNGVIENHGYLREELEDNGYTFRSQTDTEVIPHLIDLCLRDGLDPDEAFQTAVGRLQGAYAILAVMGQQPGVMYAARKASPLVLGVNGEEHFAASDPSVWFDHTKQLVEMGNDEIARLSPDGYRIRAPHGDVTRPPKTLTGEFELAERRDFPHWMLQEIHEQPQVVRAAISGRVFPEQNMIKLGGLESPEVRERLRQTERLLIVACGSSYHAGLIGERLIEEIAGVPVEVQDASEFNYRDEPIGHNTAVLAISQSGETADTNAAVEKANKKGLLTLGINNSPGSTLDEITDAGVHCRAGKETSVASTKAFVSQVLTLAEIALVLGRNNNPDQQHIMQELTALPEQIEAILADTSAIEAAAEKYAGSRDFLYMGRGYEYPTALEGALKLKEISYIHAEGYSAGAMKHGPLALIDEDFPTLAIATDTDSPAYGKTLSNIQEVKARSGPVLALATEGNPDIEKLVDDVLFVPKTTEQLQPILNTVVLQLLAYHVAVKKGLNVDQPRNLAKSVTVE
jgi:glucosamine--fructose-6-phosphate aminotransferase (isomerizing)